MAGVSLQIVRGQACVFCYAGQHFRSDFIAVMEGENVIRPATPAENPMRAGLANFLPADLLQGFENFASLAGRP
jgi:hypothetical protein